MKFSKYRSTLTNYIRNNYKEYILVSLIFLIGIFVGVMIINNSKDSQISEITTYINGFITKYKQIQDMDKMALIIDMIKKNLIFAIVLWIAGTTVIGTPIVLSIIFIRGAVLGFTISSITMTFGPLKGTLFCLLSIFLHNIFYIPAMLTISVSSIKLHKSIIKDKGRDNIRLEIIRHSLISCFMIIFLIMSVIIENAISTELLKMFIKYF